MGKIKCPLLAVDIIIRCDREMEKIVLIKRRNFPFGWALPGGFVEYGESVENTAIREAKEETNLDIEIVRLLGVYSDPHRDPRGHCVSIVFIANSSGKPVGGDDAKESKLFSIFSLPEEMAFDHRNIINDYIKEYIYLK